VDQGVKEDSKEWGRYMRREYNGYDRQGTLQRVKDEQWGVSAARPGAGTKLLIPQSCPARLMYIHRAYVESMSEDESKAFYLRFVAKGSPKQKADAMGVSVKTFYRRLDAAVMRLERA
jgi:hypothetical protein